MVSYFCARSKTWVIQWGFHKYISSTLASMVIKLGFAKEPIMSRNKSKNLTKVANFLF